MQENDYKIALLIAKYIAGTINADELQELNAWKEDLPENESLFKELIKPENFNQLNLLSLNYDKDKAWNIVKGKIDKKTKFSIKLWFYYAAAIILIPLLLFFFYKKDDNLYIASSNASEIHEIEDVNIVPGSSKATLILGDGSAIELDDEQAFQLQEKEGTRISKESSLINYESNSESQELIYNQINVPRGGEYSVVLSDGTKVFLNAKSSLRYPVNFLTDSRIVELTGEAYFEVKKSDKAFVVSTQDSKIEVLGTSFNVSSYPEDNAVRTTLVEGKVKIQLNDKDKEVVLTPSQQFVFDRSNKEFSVKKVDISPYIAWKDGLFYFKDWQLKDIMNYLSRWYDFDVSYQSDKVQNYRFGGSRIFVGHTIFTEIVGCYGDKVIDVNVDNKKNKEEKRARALLLKNNKIYLVYDSGKLLEKFE